jgi:iron(III) transport system substrate-binding protein
MGRELGSIRLLVLLGLCLGCLASCRPGASSRVVIYTSQDQVYAEPILREFTRQTGLEVGAVYDSEAVKTVGLANRLLAERRHPQCDLFWNNEELRSRQLADQGIFRETNGWHSFGFRSRRLVVNTNRLSLGQAPRSLAELTNTIWRGTIVLAYPLFGTTATHFLALRQKWGDTAWKTWCQALRSNRPFLVDGNSVVVKWVGRGEAWIGLTDSDDIQAGQHEGLPIAEAPLNADLLLIPNTVGLVRGGPNPAGAQQLLEYLRSPPVLAQLIRAQALEGASVDTVSAATLRVDWPLLLRDLAPATATLKEIFLRTE